MIARALPILPMLLSALSIARAELPPPNIILFLADDMGMGDTSAYQDWSGNADTVQLATPSMERLAKQGVRFTDAHSPSSRCSPSRYALLTGRYAWRTHLKHWVLFGVQGDPLIERSRVTLPVFLQNHGYTTGMVGKWHLGLTYSRTDGTAASAWDDADLTMPILNGPTHHGFSFFHGISRSHKTSGPNGADRNTPDQSIGPGWIHGTRVIGATGDGKKLDEAYRLKEIAPVLRHQATRFLSEAIADSSPFFLYVASPANHSPYTPCDELGSRAVAGHSKFKDGSRTNSKRLDFIYENDVQLGLLLDWLDLTDDPRRPEHKLANNTLVIFASDNGAESKAKSATGPLRSNKGSIYEGGHRIPFIARWPAGTINGGRTCTRILGLNDIFATVAEIIQTPLPRSVAEDSISQLGALRGQEVSPRPPIFSNDHKEASKKLSRNRAWVALCSNGTPLEGQWKLFLDQEFAWKGKLNPMELYELKSDPLEQNNRLEDSNATPALEFLLQKAEVAAGDSGRTRE